MPLNIAVDEKCPRCGKPITVAVIDLHPTRLDKAIESFECAGCGYVKTAVLSLRSNKKSKAAA
jgi:uncharacterized Zn finger protein